ncbi:MAG: ABC transporter ATP-binding protein [Opitutales bacterium]
MVPPTPAEKPVPGGLCLRGLRKAFGAQRVLENVDLELPDGTIQTVLGESGCGKTTLLRILAGTIPADAGRIELDGRVIDGLAPRERGVLHLGQEALLFDHLDCYENIAFALRLRRAPAAEIESLVEPLLEATGLGPHRRKRAWELSGGQKQRAAFARALVARPRVLLLDEPFGSLDGETRHEMQILFTRLAREHAMTALFVTHDLKEAIRVGDRYATLRGGGLHCYPDRRAFLADPASGVPDEIAFWQTIGRA